MDEVWDPLRKKYVCLTPEERVRQWCIGMLAQTMKIPMHMMMSEIGFKLGGKQYRADILVYDRNARPLMVVECKRPDVKLDAKVADQAIRYNMVLDVTYIMVSNGNSTFLMKKADGRFAICTSVPTWEQMLEES